MLIYIQSGGEVRIGNTSIHRAAYSQAIPKLLEILDSALAILFPAQDAVKKLFDTKNQLVLDTVGSATAVVVEQPDGLPPERLLLSSIVPTFTNDGVGKCFSSFTCNDNFMLYYFFLIIFIT